MMNLIGGILKYSFLVVLVLVLSHVIEVKGVSISQHVYRGMHGMSYYSPTAQANRITASMSQTMKNRMSDLDKFDSDIATSDQKALAHVIETSQGKRK